MRPSKIVDVLPELAYCLIDIAELEATKIGNLSTQVVGGQVSDDQKRASISLENGKPVDGVFAKASDLTQLVELEQFASGIQVGSIESRFTSRDRTIMAMDLSLVALLRLSKQADQFQGAERRSLGQKVRRLAGLAITKATKLERPPHEYGHARERTPTEMAEHVVRHSESYKRLSQFVPRRLRRTLKKQWPF